MVAKIDHPIKGNDSAFRVIFDAGNTNSQMMISKSTPGSDGFAIECNAFGLGMLSINSGNTTSLTLANDTFSKLFKEYYKKEANAALGPGTFGSGMGYVYGNDGNILVPYAQHKQLLNVTDELFKFIVSNFELAHRLIPDYKLAPNGSLIINAEHLQTKSQMILNVISACLGPEKRIDVPKFKEMVKSQFSDATNLTVAMKQMLDVVPREARKMIIDELIAFDKNKSLFENKSDYTLLGTILDLFKNEHKRLMDRFGLTSFEILNKLIVPSSEWFKQNQNEIGKLIVQCFDYWLSKCGPLCLDAVELECYSKSNKFVFNSEPAQWHRLLEFLKKTLSVIKSNILLIDESYLIAGLDVNTWQIVAGAFANVTQISQQIVNMFNNTIMKLFKQINNEDLYCM